MKTYCLGLLALFAPTATFAHHHNDTIVNVKQAHHVLITENDSALKINIQGAQQDADYRFHYQVPTQGNSLVDESGKKWDFSLPTLLSSGKRNLTKSGKKRELVVSVVMPSFSVGFNNFSFTDGNYNNIVGSSLDYRLTLFRTRYTYERFSIYLDWSYEWAKYRLETPHQFAFDGARVAIANYAEGTMPGRSVFRLNSHNLALKYRQKIVSHLGATAAVELNFHHRPRIYNTYYRANNIIFDTYKENIHYRPLTTSFMFALDYRNSGLFVRYTPMSMFEKGFGPQWNTLAFGVLIGIL